MELAVGKYRGSKEYFLAYSALISAARFRGTVTYEGLAKALGFPTWGRVMARKVAGLIGEVTEDENAFDRPMLGALVVRIDTGLPGNGFFKLAESLGKLKKNSGKSARRHFWEEEKRSVYDCWK
jgi:hypothetical protein